MDNVLIAEDESRFLYFLEEALEEFSDRFRVLTAGNGLEALAVLESKSVSVLVTDLNMPRMDGFTLLSHVNERYPDLPIIVMTGYDRPEIRAKLPKDLVSFLEKPFSPDKLANAIIAALARDAPEGAVKGISLPSFLQLIGMEQKTCLMEVSSKGQPPGILYFEKGVPFDAVFGPLTGQEAALKVIGLENPGIKFLKPPSKKVKRRISSSLANLVMDATRAKDEFETDLVGGDEAVSRSWGNGLSEGGEPDLFSEDEQEDSGTHDELAKSLSEMAGCLAVAVLDGSGSLKGSFTGDSGIDMKGLASAASDCIMASQNVARALNAPGETELFIRLPGDFPAVAAVPVGRDSDLTLVAVLAFGVDEKAFLGQFRARAGELAGL